LKPSQKTYF